MGIFDTNTNELTDEAQSTIGVFDAAANRLRDDLKRAIIIGPYNKQHWVGIRCTFCTRDHPFGFDTQQFSIPLFSTKEQLLEGLYDLYKKWVILHFGNSQSEPVTSINVVAGTPFLSTYTIHWNEHT